MPASAPPQSHESNDDSRAPAFVYLLIVIVEIVTIAALYAFSVHFS